MIPLPIRIDVETLPALLVGAFLLCAATVQILRQWWAHRQLDLNPKLDEAAYTHLDRQIRSRLIVGVLLFALGIAIPLGDQLDFFFRAHPSLFFVYWIAVLLAVFGMVILALTDAAMTVAYARVSQSRLRKERQQIEDEIRRYRASKNGSADREVES